MKPPRRDCTYRGDMHVCGGVSGWCWCGIVFFPVPRISSSGRRPDTAILGRADLDVLKSIEECACVVSVKRRITLFLIKTFRVPLHGRNRTAAPGRIGRYVPGCIVHMRGVSAFQETGFTLFLMRSAFPHLRNETARPPMQLVRQRMYWTLGFICPCCICV